MVARRARDVKPATNGVGVIYLVPERPIQASRGIAAGITTRGLRDKQDRF
jgi:hypothetical protein